LDSVKKSAGPGRGLYIVKGRKKKAQRGEMVSWGHGEEGGVTAGGTVESRKTLLDTKRRLADLGTVFKRLEMGGTLRTVGGGEGRPAAEGNLTFLWQGTGQQTRGGHDPMRGGFDEPTPRMGAE